MNRARVYQLGATMIVLTIVAVVMGLLGSIRDDQTTAKAAPTPVVTTTPDPTSDTDTDTDRLVEGIGEIIDEVSAEKAAQAKGQTEDLPPGIEKIEIPESIPPEERGDWLIDQIYRKPAFLEAELTLILGDGQAWAVDGTDFTANSVLTLTSHRKLPNLVGQTVYLYSVAVDGVDLYGYMYEGRVRDQANEDTLAIQYVSDSGRYQLAETLPTWTTDWFVGPPTHPTPELTMAESEMADYLAANQLCGVTIEPESRAQINQLIGFHQEGGASELLTRWEDCLRLTSEETVFVFRANVRPGPRTGHLALQEVEVTNEFGTSRPASLVPIGTWPGAMTRLSYQVGTSPETTGWRCRQIGIQPEAMQ